VNEARYDGQELLKAATGILMNIEGEFTAYHQNNIRQMITVSETVGVARLNYRTEYRRVVNACCIAAHCGVPSLQHPFQSMNTTNAPWQKESAALNNIFNNNVSKRVEEHETEIDELRAQLRTQIDAELLPDAAATNAADE
jgi:hypothetical protein